MSETFIQMLNEPRNSLGRTEEVVAIVLKDHGRIDELYACYFQPDEWVRLRTSSSFKRIWRADVELFKPFIDRFVKNVSQIDQPSVQWTFSQMCLDLGDHLTSRQVASATKTMRTYLSDSTDWIVQNTTIEALATWAVDDPRLKKWLLPVLRQFAKSDKKSVARRAAKWIDKLA
ncbi:MAG: hypothetical protein AB8G17_00720 [Gammaproteobacteria bacterium]